MIHANITFENITFEDKGGIGRITMNRPERLNAMNWNMHEEIVRALQECGYRDDIRAVVITGAGRTFCVGDDVKEFVPERLIRWPPKDEHERSAGSGQYVFKAVLDVPKPVIAMVNGHAHGAGFGLCLACDFRIASEQATFRYPHALRGHCAGTEFLPQYVGIGKAFELLMLSKQIDAREAECVGLVNKVVPPEQLEAVVMGLANELANGPTKVLGFMKKALNHGRADKFEFQSYMAALSLLTEDYPEAKRAFLEKREPKFQGK